VAGGARGAEIVLIRQALDDVRDYMKNRSAYERASLRDLSLSRADLEALIPVVEGRMPLIAVADRASDIRAVLKLAHDEKIKVILSGAAEAWRVAPEIAAAGAPVLLRPTTDRPETMEMLGATLENAARLEKAGVIVVLEGSNGAHRIHELRYNAGVAVANGMSKAGALAAIPSSPCPSRGSSWCAARRSR
jgi:imidazolonepropionase-like amidohydrolase